MNVEELIKELQKLKNDGHGDLKVKFDYGACEVKRVYIEEGYSDSDELSEYVHLDWA